MFNVNQDERTRIRCETRNRLGLKDEMVFLTCAQLIHRKGLDVLIRAYSRLTSQSPPPALLILGSGPDENQLKELTASLKATGIQFLGFVQPRELSSVFMAADVFVLASRHEGWGLVINEAANAGLPMIATETVGAARHLVKDGENGFVVAGDSVDELHEALDKFVTDPSKANRFGRESIRIAEEFTPEKMAQKLYEAIEDSLLQKLQTKDLKNRADGAEGWKPHKRPMNSKLNVGRFMKGEQDSVEIDAK